MIERPSPSAPRPSVEPPEVDPSVSGDRLRTLVDPPESVAEKVRRVPPRPLVVDATMEVDAADVEIIAQALAAQEANAAPPSVPPSLPSSPLRLSTPPPVPVGLPVVAPLSPTIEERVSYEPPLAAAPRPPFATLFRVGRESSNLALVALAASGVAFLTSLVALAAALTALAR